MYSATSIYIKGIAACGPMYIKSSTMWAFLAAISSVTCTVLRPVVSASVPESRDYCLHESFNATCRPGTAILMTSAIYGRMRLGRCISGDFNIGCSKDVISYFDRHCTGRHHCDVTLRNLVDVHPCQRDFMSYLEASFRCVPATQVDQCPNRQRRVQLFVNQTTNDGHLVFDPRSTSDPTASAIATASTERHIVEDKRHPISGRGSGLASSQSPPVSDASSRRLPANGDILGRAPPAVGVETCPWTISAKPGQRLQLKIYVLGVSPSVSSGPRDGGGNDDNVHQQLEEDHVIDDVDDPTSGSGGHHVTCSAVFVVGDSSVRETTELAVCSPSGRSRVRHLYTSVGHQVSLYMTDGSDDDRYQLRNDDDESHLSDVMRTSPFARFMISYEALGCPDIVTPYNAWMERTGDRVMIKCNDTLETWFLTCQGIRWIGDVTNCSSRKGLHRSDIPAGISTGVTIDDETGHAYSIHGVVLAVLLGVVLGIFIGMLLLLSLYCAKKKRSVASKRHGFNRAILMMPGSSDQSSSTIDGQLTATSGTVRCGYRVTDTAAVGCYYPPPITNDKLYDTTAAGFQGQGQRPVRCRNNCQSHQSRHDDNRKSSMRLLPRDECTVCAGTDVYRCAADVDECGIGVIGSMVDLDLVAETCCAVIRNNQSCTVKSATQTPSDGRRRHYTDTTFRQSTDLFDVIQMSRDDTTDRWTVDTDEFTGLQQHQQQPEVSVLDGYLQDRCGSGLPSSTAPESTATGCPSTSIGVC